MTSEGGHDPPMNADAPDYLHAAEASAELLEVRFVEIAESAHE